jgi:hypothetical protein
MSEANAHFNPQGQPESDDASNSNHSHQRDELTKSAEVARTNEAIEGANAVSNEEIDLNQLMQQIFDASELDGVQFEDSSEAGIGAIDASATGPSATGPVPPVLTNLSSIAAWSQEQIDVSDLNEAFAEAADPKTELPHLPSADDLISLIQELNQCNGVLMERVSQLEEALESSQNALQAEVARTQDVQPGYAVQDWTAVQEQITTLFNQLEFAHQTNQRQQILIETVTEQLENSQERIAQLEREAALLQQRYNEQSQLLSKSENSCRDLQARLQRQQRYTLQFKAALEKSLEVPTPQYEPVVSTEISAEVPTEKTLIESVPETPFLPKTRRIQPWSAQHNSDQSSWMKLHQLDWKTEALQVDLADPAPAPMSPPAKAEPAAQPAKPQTSHLNLPSFGLPLLQVDSSESTVDRELAEQVQRLNHDPTLKQQLDEAIKPLADMLAEALLSEPAVQPPKPSQEAAAKPIHPSAQQPAQSANQVTNQSTTQFTQSVEQVTSQPDRSADELLAATMADAEDALWQDLARLIDVSTEDVVKASLSGDLAAFESINFSNLPAEQAPASPSLKATEATQPASTSNPVEKQPEKQQSTSKASAPRAMPIAGRSQPPESQPQPEHNDQELFPAMANVSWPSPIVYPLRPTKKRQSLAMVDLPTFPKA